MRNLKFILKFVLACVLGFVLQIALHEMGHALFAFMTGNKIVDMTFGIASYAAIDVTNIESIPFISIGSFVFPVVICILLEFIPCIFVKMLNTIILTITTVQLAINSIAICCIENYKVLQTYDLGIFITSCDVNVLFVVGIAAIVTIVLLIWCVSKLIVVANEF